MAEFDLSKLGEYRPKISLRPTIYYHMEMAEYLRKFSEGMPQWLDDYSTGNDFKFDDVISSRLSYYPGFGCDGNLLTIGNRSHTIHSFVHTDYMNTREEMLRQIDHVSGYNVIGFKDWQLDRELPLPIEGTRFRFLYDRIVEKAGDEINALTKDSPYLMSHIMERDSKLDEDYGARRIVLTSSNIDGYLLYILLFITRCAKAPWLFLLQDHGFGCNHNFFGRGGLMDLLIEESGQWPNFVICEDKKGNHVWNGYRKLVEISPTIGGMHRNVRHLWNLIQTPAQQSFDNKAELTKPLIEDIRSFLIHALSALRERMIH